MRPEICNFFPIPDLLKAEHLLCIQPHPDDIEIGAGATIARISRSGGKITLLTVTDGSVGTTDPTVNRAELVQTRKKETEKSAGILGVKELLWLDYTDGGCLPYEEVRADITRQIRKLKPAAVMVCDPWLPYEAHTDHLRTGMAAAEAAFLSGMPYFSSRDMEEGINPYKVSAIAFYCTAYPNTFIDASINWDLKLAAIDCHQSQFPSPKGKVLKDYLTAKAREQGKSQGLELVETFKVLSPDHLHIFEAAWQC